jgi:preprotein translocase subunit SecE
VAEDRDKEREEGQERPSRPVTAAARRERRAGARPAGKGVPGLKGSDGAKGDGKPGTKTEAKPSAKRRADAKSDAKAVSERKGKATPVRDRKADRVGIFARLMRFLREVVSELRKVIWPTRKQMITYSIVVLVFLAFMIALVAGLDVGLAKLVFLVFGN